MLSSLHVENYRSVINETVQFGRLGVLCGPNNAGKSNLLRSINTLFGSRWPTSALSEQDRNREAAGAPIVLEARFDSSLTKDYYGTKFAVDGFRLVWNGPDDNSFVCTDASGAVVTTRTGRELSVDNETRHQLSAIHVEALRDLGDELRASQYTVLGRLLTMIRDKMVLDAVFLKEHEARARSLADHVKAGPVRTLEDTLNQEMRGITGFSTLSIVFDPPQLLDSLKALRISLSERAGLPEHPVEELGQGLQSALVVAFVRAFQRMTQTAPLLLLEEPESNLHPQGRRSFFEIIKRVASESPSQVICSTHSTEFVDLSVPDQLYVVRKSRARGSYVMRGDSSRLSDPDRAELKLAIEFNPSLRETVFASCAVLCEGSAEESALPELMRRTGRDPDSEGITVREVGGKENLPFFCGILSSLGVPTIAAFDSDLGTRDYASYHMPLNSKIEAAVGGSNGCWISEPDFESQNAIPSTDRSKARSALVWARSISDAAAQRVIGQLLAKVDAVRQGP